MYINGLNKFNFSLYTTVDLSFFYFYFTDYQVEFNGNRCQQLYLKRSPVHRCRAPSACTRIGSAWALTTGERMHSDAISGPRYRPAPQAPSGCPGYPIKYNNGGDALKIGLQVKSLHWRFARLRYYGLRRPSFFSTQYYWVYFYCVCIIEA